MSGSLRYKLFAAIAIFLLEAGTASAADITWDGGGSTNFWSDSLNWSGNVLPTASDNVRFDSTSTKNSTADISFAIGSLSISSAYSGQVNVASSFTVSGASTIDGKIHFNSGILATLGAVSISSSGMFTGQSDFYYRNGVNVSNGTWSMDGAGSEVRFAAGSLVDINGLSFVEFIGGNVAGQELTMRNDTGSPTQWIIDVDNVASLTVLRVSLAQSGAGGTAAPLVAYDSIDASGNSNWNFMNSASPVPEPEVYSMLGLGLGLMGWAGRRRKPQAT